jgi:hypothetical protein
MPVLLASVFEDITGTMKTVEQWELKQEADTMNLCENQESQTLQKKRKLPSDEADPDDDDIYGDSNQSIAEDADILDSFQKLDEAIIPNNEPTLWAFVVRENGSFEVEIHHR